VTRKLRIVGLVRPPAKGMGVRAPWVRIPQFPPWNGRLVGLWRSTGNAVQVTLSRVRISLIPPWKIRIED
jgi:hypothetical protein